MVDGRRRSEQPADLPHGWARVPLLDVVEEVLKIDPHAQPDREFDYLDIASIDNNRQTIASPKKYFGREAPSRARQVVKAGDILFATVRTYLKNIALVPATYDGQLASTGFCVIRPADEINHKFIFLYTQTDGFLNPLTELQRGTSYPAVRDSDVFTQIVPLPPLAEQHRIVAKLEELFSDLDAGVAALQKAKAQLKRYRQAVLKAAVEGKLVPTEHALAQAEARVYEPAASLLMQSTQGTSHRAKRAGRLWGSGSVPELTEEERCRLPLGWTWTKVQDLGDDSESAVQVGPMSMQSRQFSETGVPVLNVGCVQWGQFDEQKLDHLPAERAAAFQRYMIQKGDVLFTRSGTVGRSAVARERQDGWLMTFHLLRVRPSPKRCLSDYLRIVFEGAGHVRRQTREASIGTTRAGFNTNLLAMLDVPLPPLPEQHRIVSEVERRLSVADEMARSVDTRLAQAVRLRQSILKRAFAGKLVPQDPNDEPAERLLERIRRNHSRE